MYGLLRCVLNKEFLLKLKHSQATVVFSELPVISAYIEVRYFSSESVSKFFVKYSISKKVFSISLS